MLRKSGIYTTIQARMQRIVKTVAIPQHFSEVFDRCLGVLWDVVTSVMDLDETAANHAVQRTNKLTL